MTDLLVCVGGPLDGTLKPAVGLRIESPGWDGYYELRLEAPAAWEWTPVQEDTNASRPPPGKAS